MGSSEITGYRDRNMSSSNFRLPRCPESQAVASVFELIWEARELNHMTSERLRTFRASTLTIPTCICKDCKDGNDKSIRCHVAAEYLVPILVQVSIYSSSISGIYFNETLFHETSLNIRRF
ncbi:hypothetical protein VTL71DRAFT_16313 [Oculimacula yallundae]|uniref:Uncharacterized protein n=1 Tax=Oculimacula yallundae TaxID=86028 RepID=A0ABR4CEP3_9HELO